MDNRKQDACCGGTKRQLTRLTIMGYRNWSYVGFMTNITGSVFIELWTWAVFYGVMSALAVVVVKYIEDISFDDTVHRILLFPISFLLVFRSNTAYARFWEGRGHFGTFNFALRELTRRSYTFIKDTSGGIDYKAKALRQNMMRMLMVLSICVRQNLRKRSGGADAHQENLDMVRPYLTDAEYDEFNKQVKNRPLLVMSWIGKYVHEANIEGKMEGGQVMMGFDDNISKALQGWMGMNKICYQPLPFPYLHMLHWMIMAWCLSLPLCLISNFGWATCFISPVISCALYAIEEVSEEIEDPFGDDLNDLPTENFEIGLRRDGRLTLSGPGPGTQGQHFEPVGEFGVDFTLPIEDLDANELKATPIYGSLDDGTLERVSQAWANKDKSEMAEDY